MATTNERLMQWLHDARSMEEQVAVMLALLNRHIHNYREVTAEAERLLGETRKQADVVRDSIERRGGDTSSLKGGGQPRTDEQSLSGAFVGTESSKLAMTRLSAYNIIIAAAASSGDRETQAICEAILLKEEAMAEWLKTYIGSQSRITSALRTPLGLKRSKSN